LAVISHCEDLGLSKGGVMHEGAVAVQMGLPGIPSACEDIMVFRDICLARLTGCPVHIAHVSTSGSVDLIRRAKQEGVPVTGETAPHYFTLDHHAVLDEGTHAKMKPPLRTPEDRAAVRKGLAEGVLDVIATDHAPHSPLEKDVDFERAAFGVIGLETALPLALALVREGVLDLAEAIGKMSANPASILGLEGGVLRRGGRADLCIVDPDLEYVFGEENIHSKSRNSPFIGKVLKGVTLMTMSGGNIVWERRP
jgi:dihydroorotase